MSEKFLRALKGPDEVRREIKEGVAEYKEDRAELAGEELYEEDNYARELNKPKVSPEASARNLQAGLERAREIIGGLKGDFIGAHYSDDYYGYKTGRLSTLDAEGEEEIVKKLALGQDWYPLFDDKLIYSGRRTADSSHFTNYIGAKAISSSDFSRNFDAETFYNIDGQPVTRDDYIKFGDEVRKMLDENYKERGVENIFRRPLPPELQAKVKETSFNYRTEQVLKDAVLVSPGTIKLKHIYGSSYFGSGGGYGSVNAYDLMAWREGRRLQKEVATKNGDNGFASGPNEATIEPGTVLICKGGDAIGRDGRSWEEIYICE